MKDVLSCMGIVCSSIFVAKLILRTKSQDMSLVSPPTLSAILNGRNTLTVCVTV